MVMSTRIKQQLDDFPITAEALRITGTVFVVIGTLGLPCKCVYHYAVGDLLMSDLRLREGGHGLGRVGLGRF